MTIPNGTVGTPVDVVYGPTGYDRPTTWRVEAYAAFAASFELHRIALRLPAESEFRDGLVADAALKLAFARLRGIDRDNALVAS